MIKEVGGNIQVSSTPPWGALPSLGKVSASPSPAGFLQKTFQNENLEIESGHQPLRPAGQMRLVHQSRGGRLQNLSSRNLTLSSA